MSFLPREGPPPAPAAGPPPGFDFDKTWQRVHVRNTFIEVDEEPHADLSFSSALDLQGAAGTPGTAVPAARTWRRPGHLRCASEPMSFFLSQPPWEPGAPGPWEPLSGAFSMPSATPDRSTERGRPVRSLNQSQMSQMTIRESLEEYDGNPEVPQYIGPKVVTQKSEAQWCGEPMLVDVRKSSPFRNEDEALATSPDWSGAVPTLALPLRPFRHARQRSRTIQEDAELAQNLDELEADKGHSGQLPWNSLGEHTVNGVNVRVRNTFIEVDEGSDGCTDPSLLAPTWRPGHLRCASEPIPSWTAPESREPREVVQPQPVASRFTGFHSRSSSYQDDDGILLQSQLGENKGPDLGSNSEVFPLAPGDREDQRQGYNSPARASCKWHSRGSCKYGDACRFSHATAPKAPKSKNSEPQRPQVGPLPAGLVPGGSPFPVGALSPEAPKPQPAGLLPEQPERPTRGPAVPQASASRRRCRSVSPVSTTAGSSAGDAADKAPGSQRSPQGDKSHQVFWCDARAFKHEFQGFREELESAIGVAAKSHKTAEKCMRLLKKKQRVQAERGRRLKARPLIFLVSWANAQELVEFLQEAQHMPPLKVVVLCDTNGPRTRATAERWARDMSVVESVAATWPEAVKAVQTLLSSSSALSQQGNA